LGQPTRTYADSEIVVYWYPELCIHARHCVNVLPEVFRPEQRPWVRVDGASPLEIILTIDRCPSGALRYALPERSAVHPAAADGPGRQLGGESDASQAQASHIETRTAVKVTVVRNGPLLTEGAVKVVNSAGLAAAEADRLSFCRCGLSAKKPFCDGTHGKKGWTEEAK
jgi:uncharacterized Fe-S cluster protein YjdI